jgi:hypothetical protein
VYCGNVVLLEEHHAVKSCRRCVDTATRSRWTNRLVLIVLLSDRKFEEARDGLSFVIQTKLSLVFYFNQKCTKYILF